MLIRQNNKLSRKAQPHPVTSLGDRVFFVLYCGFLGRCRYLKVRKFVDIKAVAAGWYPLTVQGDRDVGCAKDYCDRRRPDELSQ